MPDGSINKMIRVLFQTISFLIFSFYLVSTASSAEITVDNYNTEKDGSYSLILEGDIVTGDFDRLLSTIRKAGRFPNTITLVSDGGDVYEGLRIGRFIRESLAWTNAYDGAPGYCTVGSGCGPCNSTCFLIWVAGVTRHQISWNSGALGMHRPYFDPSYFKGLTPKQAEEEQDAARTSVRDYLLEMDISQKVIDEMMAIPSYELKRLTDDWISENIGPISPGFEEWSVANCGPLLKGQEWEDFKTIEYKKEKKNFSQGYIDYLRSKQKTTTECWKRIKKEAQESIYKKMF